MHRFLRAIGFSKQYSKQEIDQLLGYVMNEPDYRTIIKSGKAKYVEIRRQTGKKTGISVSKRKFFKLFYIGFPALHRIYEKTAIQSSRHNEFCTKQFAEFGRDNQPAFGIYRMSVFTHEHASSPSFVLSVPPLSTISEPQYATFYHLCTYNTPNK